MLALAYTLVHENLHDRAFLARYTVGFDRFERYLRGETDGCPKHRSGPRACPGFQRKASARSPAHGGEAHR